MVARPSWLAVVLVALPQALGSQQQTPPEAAPVILAFRQIAAQPLWPGFEPATTPIEFFDGANTYLLNHPSPPDGFRPVAGQERVYSHPGQHESVRANTGTDVNGVPTATADLSANSSPPNVLAALLVHEAFHVFQSRRYPKWGGNEADLFVYPVRDAQALAERRLESAALVRALEAKDQEQAVCWARAALAMRHSRFGRLPAAAAAYERGTELREGLAQYVQLRSIGKAAALTVQDFPADHAQVRQRAYASGQALALLLDRLDPAGRWNSELGSDPPASLDELLARRLPGVGGPGCEFTTGETQKARTDAEGDVASLVADASRRKQEFLGAAGIRLEIVAGKEPLWPQAFDPWNVVILDDKEVLHTRWVKLGNGNGAVEILGGWALTEAAGAHPLFNGVRRLIVTGLADPKVAVQDGKVTIDAAHAKASFVGSLERADDVVRVRLP